MARKTTESDIQEGERKQLGRRKLVKALGAGGTGVLVSQWSKPIVDSVILPLHAQASPPPPPPPVFTIECSAESEGGKEGEAVCSDGKIINIRATVSPIPPVGTEIQCDPSTDDPNHPTGPGAIGVTDAAGNTSIAELDLLQGFSPEIAPGSTLTLTFKFVDQQTFGTNTCEWSCPVVACGED